MIIYKAKYFISGLLAAVILVTMAACEAQPAAAGVDGSNSLQAQFVEVGSYIDYKVVYNAANRVMYAVSDGPHNRGTFTLLVNEDGSPMIWKG